MVNLVEARTIPVSCDIQVDTLPPCGLSGWQYSNPLAVNRALSNSLDINLGLSEELATRYGKRKSNES